MKISQNQNLKRLLLFLLLAAALWVGFGPVQLGGPVSYVMINGNSMEPDFQRGDLVFARAQSSYHLDQSVVYRHPEIGFVFHRIVGQDGPAFILKGDHNDWLDSYHPQEEEILGAYWWRIPGGGKIIQFLRQPWLFVVVLLAAAVMVYSLMVKPGRDPSRPIIRGKSFVMNNKSLAMGEGDFRQEILVSLGLLFLAGLIFGLIAFSKPLQISISDDIPYSQQSEFSYSASDAGGIYDRSGVKTGDPLYPALTCQLDLDYLYHFSSDGLPRAEAADLEGTLTLYAAVRDADGWNRRFLLIPEYPFSGTSVRASSALNVCTILDLIEDKELKTGTEGQRYSLAIQPEIDLTGTLQGLPFQESYRPQIEFNLSQQVLSMEEDSNGPDLTQEGVLSRSRLVENTMLVLGQTVRVRTARWIGGVAVLLALLGGVYPAYLLYRDWRRSPLSRIEVENQPLLIHLKPDALPGKGNTFIEVASFQDLKKLAERCGSLILHQGDGESHTYFVQHGEVYYRYELENASQEDLDQNPPAEKSDRG